MTDARRTRGFTLIELLVVIAIIGILAAMLFPVFARARESARKTQCLSNVKNIAMGIQMYLSDYDRMPPTEQRSEVVAFFLAERDGCHRQTWANPYLKWPVILDEYVKDRDVWRCPNAVSTGGAEMIVPEYYQGGWFGYWVYWQGQYGHNAGGDPGGPCNAAYPPGWGGTVTDSYLQHQLALSATGDNKQPLQVTVAPGAFTNSIDCGQESLRNLSTAQIDEPASWVVCGDTGNNNWKFNGGTLAYPDLCLPCPCISETENMRKNPELRKPYARHMGGSNLGFADGHARWMNSEAILNQSPRYACGCWGGDTIWRGLKGLGAQDYPTSAGGAPGHTEGSFPGCGVPLY